MNKKLNLYLCAAVLLFSACASKPKFEGIGDLCGLIVDEKNRPVSDFVVYCNQDLTLFQSAVTNSNGIFVIHNVPSGNYYFTGQKDGYAKLKEQYFFSNRTDIFCCQLKSLDGVFETVEQLVSRGELENARLILEEISCSEKSEKWLLVQTYRFFLSKNTKEKQKIISLIKKNTRKTGVNYSDYAKTLEEYL